MLRQFCAILALSGAMDQGIPWRRTLYILGQWSNGTKNGPSAKDAEEGATSQFCRHNGKACSTGALQLRYGHPTGFGVGL